MNEFSGSGLARIYLLGTQLTLCSREQLLVTTEKMITSRHKGIILSGNILAYNLAYEQETLRDFFNRADVVRLDGAGVRLGARILGYDTPERMTWADFGWDLARLCEQRGFTLFLLGAKPGVSDKAAARLKGRFPDLRVVGTHHGYFDKTRDSLENRAVIQRINTLKPNVLIVGFGMPLQERWLMDNWDDIRPDVTFTGGAVFDYISGDLRRPPGWMIDHGFEWLGRLMVEPQRLWKRYVIGNPLFLYRVLNQRLKPHNYQRRVKAA
jgi:N-acetylglucosaminyldiphosphoundecaprenol N-acetyl-beta-D-mannosaminyltransferase